MKQFTHHSNRHADRRDDMAAGLPRRLGTWRTLPIVLLLVLAPCTPDAHGAFRIRSVRLDGVTHVFLRDVAQYYGMNYHVSGKHAVLNSNYSRLQFETDRRRATFTGVRVHLSYAPRAWRSEVVISETDFRLLLDPLLRSRVLRGDAVRTIVIDPGHGGTDPGAKGIRHWEKDLNLAVARELTAILRQRGYQVHLTRSGDTTVSLAERAAVARRLGADVFVSIHANAADNPAVRGGETFFLTPRGTPSTHSAGATNAGAQSGNAFDRNNARLAYEIQKYMVAATDIPDRGTKHANFAVLRDAGCPAVLVEMGFMTNPRDEQLMASDSGRRAIARGVAYGIISYHNALHQHRVLSAAEASRRAR